MSPPRARASLAFLPVLTIALASPPQSAANGPGVPPPLIEFHFSMDATNSGTLGGAATLVEYAPGQGPRFGLGHRGTGLDLTASSRGGGTDNTKSGGGAILKDPRLTGLGTMTLTLWFQPIGPNMPARLIHFGPRADVHVSNGSLGFKIQHKKVDVPHGIPRSRLDLAEGRWHFLALTHDPAKGEASVFHAGPGTAPRPVATWSNIPPPDAAPAFLEIGNLHGIRPLHGLIDCVRLHDSILSPDQIAAIARADDRPPRTMLNDPSPPRPALFRQSDVCFTSRSRHTNSVETFRAFRANRLLWSYAHDADFARALRAAGAETFQGTINSLPGTAETAAHALDFDGNPMVAPWMRAFSKKSPVYWGCNNRPRFMGVCLERAAKAIEAGADMLQFDDWALIASASGWGGACFCTNCMAAFPADLRANVPPAELARLRIPATGPFDYRHHLAARHGITNAAAYAAQKRSLPTSPHFDAFHRRSIRAFFKDLGARIDAIAGRHVPMSINANLADPSQQRRFLTDIVDFVQGETLHFHPDQLALASKIAEGMGKWHVFVTQSLDVPEARAGIATVYALGQLPMVPWDMYMGSDETKIQPRGWGTVEQYGDLFHFVRDNPTLLDDAKPLATAGLIIDIDHCDRSQAFAACRRLLDAQVPFAVIPVGDSFFRVPLRAEHLAAFDALLLAGDASLLNPEDRAALAAAAADVPILSADTATDASLDALAFAEVWGPHDIHVIPRIPSGANPPSLLLHVINRASPESSLRWLSFAIRRRALPESAISSIRWHAPGEAPIDLEWETLPAGCRILIPKMREWGIAEVKF